MRRPNLRIRVQLTVSVCLFTLVCLVSLAIAIYVLSRNTLLNLQIGNLDLNSRMLREECRQEFSDIFESFSRLSYSSPVRDIYKNYTSSEVITEAANLLHDSFGLDRILLMKLYLPNGTEILEVDSKVFHNRSGLPQSLLPITYAGANLNQTLSTIIENDGQFVGPVRAQKPIGGTDLMVSLTVPIKDEKSRGIPLISLGKNALFNSTIGYATFLINSLKLQKILKSVSLSSASNDAGTAALCTARNNFTTLDQLIPFNDNSSLTSSQNVSGYYEKKIQGILTKLPTPLGKSVGRISKRNSRRSPFNSDESIAIPPKMAASLRADRTPTAEYNKGPAKSMISIAQFDILNSTYYVVVLQSHDGVFTMPHHLRGIIVGSSCIIGAVMIIFTFLFVSFGARQILRLKMAATYEQPAPSRWKFLPLPWWLRPSNRKTYPDTVERSEMQVPEKVPLRKHVRDELDDITERFNAMSNELRKQCRRLEDRVAARKAEIEQAREAADHANAAKSHFLARVTHELRNPLNGIIGTATLCLEDSNVENIQNSLKTIFKCGELLLNLMVDLLSFSKTEVENLHLEPRDFTLKEITSQLQVIFTEQCAARKISLAVNNNEKFDNYVFSGDTNRILQVIFNLMSNGIKFTPEGGQVQLNADVSITDQEVIIYEDVNEEQENDGGHVEDSHEDTARHNAPTGEAVVNQSESDNADNGLPVQRMKKKRPVHYLYKTLRFDVTDNGPGIAPDLQSRVFEEFVQGDISPHVKKSGVGLGLCICRQLAERMRGSVTLKSEVGKGSTFTFQLPLPYRTVNSPMSKNSGEDELELTSYASMLRIADFQTDKTMSEGMNPDSAEYITADDPPSAGHADPEQEKALVKSSRNILPGAQKARDFLLSRRKISDTLSKFGGHGSDSGKQYDRNDYAGWGSPTAHSPGRSSSGKNTLNSNAASQPTDTSDSSSKTTSLSAHSSKPAVSPAVSKSADGAEETRGASTPPQQPYTSFLNNKLGTTMPDVLKSPTATRPPMSSKNSSYNGKPPPDLKVLIVDDNCVNQEVMIRMLNLEGLKNIRVANDGTEALSRINEANGENAAFDVIFMDVQMPKMDGREATRIIRNEFKSSVPIVAVSAFANETNADDCILAGMNLFLSKPLRRPHLREILRGLASITSGESEHDESKDTPKDKADAEVRP